MAKRLRIHYAVDAYSMKHRRKEQQAIVKLLRRYGQVFNEHAGSRRLCRRHKINKSTKNGRMRCGNKCLEACDVLVANCTVRSHGVGRKIERAEWLNKERVILYDTTIGEHPLSDFVDGDDQLWLVEYSTLRQLASQLKDKFETIRTIVPFGRQPSDKQMREVQRSAVA